MISKVSITNFKSIKNLELDCKKINLFIGKPNVGKSNILEGLSFVGERGVSNIRFESIRNLFYDQDIREPIVIKLDNIVHYTEYDVEKKEYASYLLSFKDAKVDDQESIRKRSQNLLKKIKSLDIPSAMLKEEYNFDERYKSLSLNNLKYPNLKKYTFKNNQTNSHNNKRNASILDAPFGENLFDILKNNRELLNEVSDLFGEYGYSLIIDFVTNEAEIQKIVGNVSYKIPYSLVADTLQRIVFYKVAIRTNDNCSILLEEPENHSFPPYIRDIAFEIMNSSNQYFIATHSPYLVNTIISDAKKEDLAINIVTYSDFETKVKTMSQEEIADLTNYGIDLFFNLDMFAK